MIFIPCDIEREWCNIVVELQDLAKAFIQVLDNEKASKQVFNISGEKYVTFDGLARACAKVIPSGFFAQLIRIHEKRLKSNEYYLLNLLFSTQAAGFPEPEIVHYNPKEFDFGKKKAFPFRDQVSLDRNFSHNFRWKT